MIASNPFDLRKVFASIPFVNIFACLLMVERYSVIIVKDIEKQLNFELLLPVRLGRSGSSDHITKLS